MGKPMVFPWFSYAFADEITKTIASMALKTSPRVALSTAATRVASDFRQKRPRKAMPQACHHCQPDTLVIAGDIS